MSSEKWISDYCMVRSVDGPADVLIVFSPARVPARRFMLYRAFQDLPVHQIFVNCPNNGWYVDGVPGLGAGLEDVARALDGEVRRLLRPKGKVLCIGSSMGAFAAVAIGAMINADLVLATGGKYVLSLPGGLSEDTLSDRARDVNLGALIRAADGAFHLVCGGEAALDLQCLADLDRTSGQGICGYVLDGRGHSLPPYLDARYGYARLVQGLLQGAGLPFEDELDGLHRAHDLCFHLWCAHHPKGPPGSRDRATWDWLSARREGYDNPKWRGRVLFALSVLAPRLGEGSALDLAQRAATLMPGNVFCQNHHARMLLAAGHLHRAEAVARASLQSQMAALAQRDALTPMLLSRILRRQDRMSEAISVLAEADRADPRKMYRDEVEKLRAAVQTA